MKERPILFSAPMVRAILAGTKTQTRRVVNPQPTGYGRSVNHPLFGPCLYDPIANILIHCQYGFVGDGLWVRETWGHFERNDTLKAGDAIYYRADGECLEIQPWRPSIHMPRWASRITLEVTGVRLEHLQDISDADAVAEGMSPCNFFRGDDDLSLSPLRDYLDGLKGRAFSTTYPVARFAQLLTKLNGVGIWEQNPWVWVIEFKRFEG